MMRVSIEHGTETSGLLRKKTYYTVAVQVDFNDDELVILKKADLMNDIVLERDVPPNRYSLGSTDDDEQFWRLTVKKLMRPKDNLYIFNTTAEAQRYEDVIKEKLQLVKHIIDGHREVPVENKSYEL